MTISLSRIATLLATLALLVPAGRAGAAEIKVLSTVALSEAWHELQPKFEATGHKLTLVLGTSGGVNLRSGIHPSSVIREPRVRPIRHRLW